jgi:hypothetical protein
VGAGFRRPAWWPGPKLFDLFFDLARLVPHRLNLAAKADGGVVVPIYFFSFAFDINDLTP